MDFAASVSYLYCAIVSKALKTCSRPSSPVTMKEGRRRLSWFDIFHMPPCPSCGAPGSSESVTRIEQIILAEMHTIARPKRVVVVGFSQGAALGIVLALTSLHDLGGVASLSGWIPRRCRQVSVSSTIFRLHELIRCYFFLLANGAV